MGKNDISKFTVRENIKEFTVSSTIIKLNVFFNMMCLEKLINAYEESNEYRQAFAEVAYYMYEQTKDEYNQISIDEKFFQDSEEEDLSKIVLSILESDECLSNEFDKLVIDDIFERFYIANKLIIEKSVEPLRKAFKQMDRFKSISNTASKLMASNSAIMSKSFIQSQYKLSKAFMDIAQMNAKIANSFPRFEFPQIKMALAQRPQVDFKISSLMSTLANQVSYVNNSALKQFRDSIENVTKQFELIDYSLLTYNRRWNEKHDILIKFGWFYLFELPENILNTIYEQRETISQSEVDEIIVNYFRENRCENLKCIVIKWNENIIFERRSRVFHEAIVNHSRKYYNSSTTLLALHTEGIITDFARLSLGTPRFKVKKAIEDISEIVNSIPVSQISSAEWNVFNVVLDKILETFVEQFDKANPDKTSNSCRHKIAHGHAIDTETEVNSLKQFLYLNELFRLFLILELEVVNNTNGNEMNIS
jgi:hypothetical protein